jgi:phage FluMu protein Com
MCGKKLAEAVSVTQGEIKIMCPRCKRVVIIKA